MLRFKPVVPGGGHTNRPKTLCLVENKATPSTEREWPPQASRLDASPPLQRLKSIEFPNALYAYVAPIPPPKPMSSSVLPAGGAELYHMVLSCTFHSHYAILAPMMCSIVIYHTYATLKGTPGGCGYCYKKSTATLPPSLSTPLSDRSSTDVKIHLAVIFYKPFSDDHQKSPFEGINLKAL